MTHVNIKPHLQFKFKMLYLIYEQQRILQLPFAAT